MNSRIGLLVTVSIAVVALAIAQDSTMTPVANPQSSETASEPPPERRPRPAQVDVLQDLLRDRERTRSVRPQFNELSPNGFDGDLFPEGSVTTRAGRLVLGDGTTKFRFNSSDEKLGGRTFEVLKNAWLERMERDTQAGMTEFIVSGEVTRYRGSNYLLIRNYRRQVSNGNLTP